jgi:hypothetical protein
MSIGNHDTISLVSGLFRFNLQADIANDRVVHDLRRAGVHARSEAPLDFVFAGPQNPMELGKYFGERLAFASLQHLVIVKELQCVFAIPEE